MTESYNNFAQFYDLFTDDVDYERYAAFFHTLMEKHKGKDGILLDLACGTGTLSVLFSKLGYDVIGVDSSPAMLSEALQKSCNEGENILFLNQDMREIDLYGTINCCVCTLDSLNHLDSMEDVRKTFSRVSLFMEKGGAFVFDVNTPYKHEKVLGDNSFIFEKDDTLCCWRNVTEGLKTDITLDFFKMDEDGLYERFTEEITERAFPVEDIKKALAENKFRILKIYNENFEEICDFNCERLIFAVEKE